MLEHFQRAIDGNAMDLGIDLLCAFENGIGAEVLLGAIHDLKQNAPLPGQTHTLALQCGTQATRFGFGVEPLSGRNAAVFRG